MKKTGSAVWSGGLKDGKGFISTESGALDNVAYGFNTRFEDGPGANPEQLTAGPHAACFPMAFANAPDEAGSPAKSVRTDARVTLRLLEDGPGITKIELTTVGVVPGIEEAKSANASAVV